MEVIENIFCNAIRYAKSKIKIKLEILEDDYLQLIIIDDGNGFSQEDLNYACKLYYHEEATNESYHYGIGLYLCKILCEKHNGRVVLCNNDEGGAKVITYFRIT
jgi:K+-sensing histidine kinase KdpD